MGVESGSGGQAGGRVGGWFCLHTQGTGIVLFQCLVHLMEMGAGAVVHADRRAGAADLGGRADIRLNVVLAVGLCGWWLVRGLRQG